MYEFCGVILRYLSDVFMNDFCKAEEKNGLNHVELLRKKKLHYRQTKENT
jgi:hypothetical protein